MVDPGQSTTSTQKRNVFGKKISIYIWWDEWDVLYYELLKPGETVTEKYYSFQLNHLAEKIQENSTLRYECDETFSDECEFAARAEGE